MGKMPILEECVMDEFLDVLSGLYALNPKEQPVKTIRQKWMSELCRENPIYASFIMRFPSSIESSGEANSVVRAIDTLVLGYRILKEQSVKDGNQIPIVDEEILEKVNLEFPFDKSGVDTTIFKISSENPIYWDYFTSTLATYVENEFVRENTVGFGAFCYVLLREQVMKEVKN